ncbi:MAG TPA: DUF11 domain-containing protein [Chloroflexi bacterium]|nr:DUF11 domain-containing protein [Chloroflexota bacterium]
MTRFQVRRPFRMLAMSVLLLASLVFVAVVSMADRATARAATSPGGAAGAPTAPFAGGQVDLSVVKDAVPNPVLAGQQLTYPITVTNSSTATATGVILTDTLPLQVEYVADTEGCTLSEGSGPGGADQLVCALGSLGPGESQSFDVIVTVHADAVAWESDGFGALTNTVEVTSVLTETNPSDNLYTLSSFVQDQADLQVVKVSTPETTVPAGEVFTYTLFVDNYGPSYARNVALEDNILATNDVSILEIRDDPDRDDVCALVGGEIQCTLNAPLEPTGFPPLNGRWTVVVLLRSNESQEINNTVRVFSADPDGTGPQTATPDPDPTNNQATDFIAVTAVSDLRITKTAQGQVQAPGQPGGTFTRVSDRVTAGGLLTYTLTVHNLGPSTARNVLVEDHPSSWIVVQAATPGQGYCYTDPSEGLVCALGDLGPGGAVTVRIVAEVPSSVPGGTALDNLAMVRSDVFDPDNTNDYAANTTTVDAWADLSIEKTVQPTPVLVGSPLTYTLVVRNVGPSDVQDALVSDVFPSGVGDVIWQCTASVGASCTCSGTGNLHDTVDLQAGGTLTYVAEGLLEVSYPITNTAVVTSPEGSPDPFDLNNSDSVLNASLSVYLPLVLGGPGVQAPDLVVEQINATQNDVRLVIRNVGNSPVEGGFWVDVYIDPDVAPREVNQVWGDVGDQGLVWGVTGSALPLEPGETLTLRVGDEYYWDSLSRVTWPLAPGTPVYAQVDSYGDSAYGLVRETHEIAGGGYNNITGPVSVKP